MFSMKYTSPKVTPKKDGVSPLSALDNARDNSSSASPLSFNDINAAVPKFPTGDERSNSTRSQHHYLANNLRGEIPEARHVNHSELHAVAETGLIDDPSLASLSLADAAAIILNGDGSTHSSARGDSDHNLSKSLPVRISKRRQHDVANSEIQVAVAEFTDDKRSSSALTKDNIIFNSNYDSSGINSMSENDSAVADCSEELLEPRSNLYALLDREYNMASSGFGEGPENTLLQANEGWIGNDNDADVGEGITIDTQIKESADCDQDIGIDDMTNLHSTDPSEGCTLDQTTELSHGFHRSVSMEPFFDSLPEESDLRLATHATLTEEGSVEVDIVGQTSSLLDSLDSEDGINDARKKLQSDGKTSTNPSSPIRYDLSAQPASPILSEINACKLFGDEPITIESPGTEAISEIAGDTYFDGPAPNIRIESEKARSNSIEEGMVHLTLPPRVNRTTAPFMPDCSSTDPSKTVHAHNNPFPLSPRQPSSHTHSLLDDCLDDDEEDELASLNVTDSPTRPSYSCLPRPRSNSGRSSPFSSYFKKQKQTAANRQRSSHPAETNATRVASNKVQKALLQTRHRRWDCQSDMAGSHAQSKEVFDISNRVQTFIGYISDNGEEVLDARLSVAVEAIRAAALASGLWRTVRLVKVPKGLFLSQHEFEESEVWALLNMLNSTFPKLDQIDFGGDVSRGVHGSGSDDEWRNEVLACIMECLPNIVAIDGFVVEREVFEDECDSVSEKISTHEAKGPQHDAIHHLSSSSRSRHGQKNSAACIGCESDYTCGLSDLVDSQASNGLSKVSHAARAVGDSNNISSDRVDLSRQESLHDMPGQFDGGGDIPSNAMWDAPENYCVSITDEQNEQSIIKGSRSHESVDSDMRKVPTASSSSSMLSSSRSWGSTNSGTRPPPCPSSAARPRPRLPAKPVDQKKAKRGSFMRAGSGLKRRVLGLIPTVSMMDDDIDEDDSSEDSDNGVETECPTDLL